MNMQFRFWLKAMSFVFETLGFDKVLISDGSGLQQKSTHRLRMGALKSYLTSRILTSSISCASILRMAVARAILGARLALLGLGCVLCTTVSYQANRLSSTKESASATLRNKYFVTIHPIKLYHAFR
jgi:hypothetical protein